MSAPRDRRRAAPPTITDVPDRNGVAALGLRERKKQRTRATIVEVAARLCAQQGYENTTVDQIAEAAEVSPRTFSRYFPSKEAVIGALIEETSDHVAQALARQPLDITEHEALLGAHLEVLGAAQRGEAGSMSFDRVSGFLRIVIGAPTLGLSAFAYRPGGPTRAVTDALARRMGVATGDPAVRIVLDTWAVLVAAGVDTPGVQIAAPGDIMDRIESSYSVFTRLWQPWRASGQPPSGETGR
ncbi:MAG: TetR family transcriptional regulator [Mycobacterium sp.]|nr:TetR family transcriptional regulator [Mycobacterium sp.]